MRKLFVTMLLCCISLCGFAQGHLTFKGIPIEGSLISFCQKLRANGYRQISREKNTALFEGEFTGRNAVICVGATDDGRDVHSVVVMFDQSHEWYNLVNTYDYYKKIYSLKYGDPTFCREYNSSTREENSSQMYALTQGRAVFDSVWDTPRGTIELSIEKAESFQGNVVITYRDSKNIETKIQKDLNDI